MVGVINHVPNPDVGQAVGLAQAAEGAGAGWIGVADAFWWRDVWLLLGEVASATERIELGPAMTNPYMRHRYPHGLRAGHAAGDGPWPRVLRDRGRRIGAHCPRPGSPGGTRRRRSQSSSRSFATSPPAGRSMRRRAAVSTSTSIPSRS